MQEVKGEKYFTYSREETVELGRKIGNSLKEGDTVCLNGDLGAGKTALVSGIAEGLGVETKGYITSPTFTIVNEYMGRIPFFHFDVYRVYDPDELFEIGFEEYFSRGGAVCIEWSNLIPDMLPQKRIEIEIYRLKDANKEDGREISVRRL